RAGITALRDLTLMQPARQLICVVRQTAGCSGRPATESVAGKTRDMLTQGRATMRKVILMAALLAAVGSFLLYPRSTVGQGHAGHPLVIELDNKFIETFANRATITSEFTITGISKDHPDEQDGEVHNGGWADEAGLPCVAEVMNVRRKGKEARDAFHNALNAG